MNLQSSRKKKKVYKDKPNLRSQQSFEGKEKRQKKNEQGILQIKD